MPLDHFVTLGRSGLRVSPFCLGGMTFGEERGWGSSAAVSEGIIDRYLDCGGNFIDTANSYNRGHSEKIIGDHVGCHPARRNRIVIATKFSFNLFPGDPNAGGANRKSIIAACEESLRRLRTAYIDLYWMHYWDRFTPIDETMRALEDLVTAGKVRYLGFSDTPAWKVAQAQVTAVLQGRTPLIALQIAYSLLERTVEGELIPMARELGLGVTPYGALASGVLSGKYTRANAAQAEPRRGAMVTGALTEKTFHLIDIVNNVARQLETTPARVALAWVNSRPGVASTIIGARTMEQLEENLGALDLRLSPEHEAALGEASRPKLNFPAGFLAVVGPHPYGGTTINGQTFPLSPFAPKNDAERF
ncbi:MAG TPA: aldo/keto reductase [Candidatus Binataceae bacterium]|jgi:aryl-alcohol dehydrogenase-like predicted oxidoreductase|nr:aldo/keto reductase [Candidatus Binataceae bacterium]